LQSSACLRYTVLCRFDRNVEYHGQRSASTEQAILIVLLLLRWTGALGSTRARVIDQEKYNSGDTFFCDAIGPVKVFEGWPLRFR
jgi:hypothetical protein